MRIIKTLGACWLRENIILAQAATLSAFCLDCLQYMSSPGEVILPSGLLRTWLALTPRHQQAYSNALQAVTELYPLNQGPAGKLSKNDTGQQRTTQDSSAAVRHGATRRSFHMCVPRRELSNRRACENRAIAGWTLDAPRRLRLRTQILVRSPPERKAMHLYMHS